MTRRAKARARNCGRGSPAIRRPDLPPAMGTAARARADPSTADRTRSPCAGFSPQAETPPDTRQAARGRSRRSVTASARSSSLTCSSASYDLEVALQLPIGDCVEPLPPFPVPGRGEVIDEVVAEPVAGGLRVPENARGLDQGARRARNVFRALVGAVDGLGSQLQILFDP